MTTIVGIPLPVSLKIHLRKLDLMFLYIISGMTNRLISHLVEDRGRIVIFPKLGFFYIKKT